MAKVEVDEGECSAVEEAIAVINASLDDADLDGVDADNDEEERGRSRKNSRKKPVIPFF